MRFKWLQPAKFAFCVLFFTISYQGVCNAQIVPDATLPIQSTVHQLRSSTFGQGDAGSVIINARERIDFDRGYVFSTLEDGASGKSGDITITTGSLALTNGAELVATSYGRGDAGNININARDTVRFDGVGGSRRTPSGAFSNVESQDAVGKGGVININTGSLYLSNGAIVNARTRGQGDGGNVNIGVA